MFYVSRAADAYDNKSIQSILQISRRNNRQLDITGCLLYSGRHFAQLLEGEQAAVATLMARVAKDKRHVGFRVLSDVEVGVRRYNDWAMGFMHDMAMEDELEQLQTTEPLDMPRVRRMMLRMHPDGMGGVNNLG